MASAIGALRSIDLIDDQNDNNRKLQGGVPFTPAAIGIKLVKLYGKTHNDIVKYAHLNLIICGCAPLGAEYQLGGLVGAMSCVSGDPIKMAFDISRSCGIKIEIIDWGKMNETFSFHKLIQSDDQDDQKMGQTLLQYCSNGPTKIGAIAADQSIRTLTDLLLQLTYLLGKAVTNPTEAVSHSAKLFGRRVTSDRSSAENEITDSYMQLFASFLKESLAIRKFFVEVLKSCTNLGVTGNEVTQALAAAAKFIQGAGLTPFFVTLKYARNPGIPEFEDAKFHSDILQIIRLARKFKKNPSEAGYAVLLSNPEALDYQPANFKSAFSFSLGIARVLEPTYLNYTNTVIDQALLEFGENIGRRMKQNEDGEENVPDV